MLQRQKFSARILRIFGRNRLFDFVLSCSGIVTKKKRGVGDFPDIRMDAVLVALHMRIGAGAGGNCNLEIGEWERAE
jgi:hypothetical protein